MLPVLQEKVLQALQEMLPMLQVLLVEQELLAKQELLVLLGQNLL